MESYWNSHQLGHHFIKQVLGTNENVAVKRTDLPNKTTDISYVQSPNECPGILFNETFRKSGALDGI